MGRGGRQALRRLGECRNPWAIGGADFSVNIDKADGRDPVLQGQFYMLMEKPKGDWKGRLKELINSSGSIQKPVRRSDFNGSKAQLAYAFKNEFKQRNSYIKSSSQLRNPHSNTRDKKLSRDHWLNLMQFLDRIGLEGRLIDHSALYFNEKRLPGIRLQTVSHTAKHKIVHECSVSPLNPLKMEF